MVWLALGLPAAADGERAVSGLVAALTASGADSTSQRWRLLREVQLPTHLPPGALHAGHVARADKSTLPEPSNSARYVRSGESCSAEREAHALTSHQEYTIRPELDPVASKRNEENSTQRAAQLVVNALATTTNKYLPLAQRLAEGTYDRHQGSPGSAAYHTQRAQHHITHGTWEGGNLVRALARSR